MALTSADVEAHGLAGDRRWMVVDERGAFITQRTHPRLALARVTPDAKGWRVAAAGLGTVLLPASWEAGPPRQVQVWDDEVVAVEGPADLSAWFSDLLGEPCRIVFMPDPGRRLVDSRYGDGIPVSFADAFPVLVVGASSLEDLNRRLEVPVRMDRFRPNIVVVGAGPYAEDGWAAIRIGQVTIGLVKPCSRCVVTTVDQTTGERGREPLATLAAYRRAGSKVMFGVNGIPRSAGRIACGDAVTVTQLRPREPQAS